MKRGLDISDSSSEEEIPIAVQAQRERKRQKTVKTHTLEHFGIKSKGGKFKYTVHQPEKLFWLLTCDESKPSSKICGFDMDWTLIQPKGGKKFPKGRGDWVWWPESKPNVRSKLQALHKQGFKIVVLTNQNGIEKGKQDAQEIIGKIQDVSNSCGVPFTAMIAGGKDWWRKPSTKGWNYMLEQTNGGKVIDKKVSFFVGDAAGRPKNWKKKAKKDFNCSDRSFAKNLGLPFHTPDAFFLKEREYSGEINWGGKNPKEWYNACKNNDDSLIPKPVGHITKAMLERFFMKTLCLSKVDSMGWVEKQEMMLLVGYQGSGKSSL
eukprot:UN01932